MRRALALVVVLGLVAAGAAAQDDCETPRPLALFVGGDIAFTGDPCLDGEAHAQGGASVGQLNGPAVCSGFTGTVTTDVLENFRLRTDALAFPDCTYYQVVFIDGTPPYCRILDRNGVPIQTALGDSLTDAITGTGEAVTLSFGRGDKDIDYYFDFETGVFRREDTDSGVVVDFAGASARYVAVEFSPPGAGNPIRTTVINTKFVGSGDSDRVLPSGWEGGAIHLRGQVRFQPANGLAFAAVDLVQTQGTLRVGDPESAALCVATGDADFSGGSEFHGAAVVLGHAGGFGSPMFVYDPGFFALLPEPVHNGFADTCWDQEIVSVRPVSWGGLKRGAGR